MVSHLHHGELWVKTGQFFSLGKPCLRLKGILSQVEEGKEVVRETFHRAESGLGSQFLSHLGIWDPRLLINDSRVSADEMQDSAHCVSEM